jgi:ankyrin repeat protein
MWQETLKSQARALYYALWEGNTDAAKILVENGAKVSVTREMLRDKNRMKNILDAKAMDFKAKNNGGLMQLHMAAMDGQETVIELLLKNV